MTDPEMMKQAVVDGIREGMLAIAPEIGRAIAESMRGDVDEDAATNQFDQVMDILQRLELLLQFISDNTQQSAVDP